MHISPKEILPEGTKVRLTKRGEVGTVVSHWIADNGVAVHRVKVTQRYNWSRRRYQEIEPYIWQGNYAFVEEI